MFLSNVDIKREIDKGNIIIKPYNEDNIQGASVDFRLGNKFLIPKYYDSKSLKSVIEINEDFPYEEFFSDRIIIMPHHFILGTTLEKLTLSNNLCARVDGKSRIGRKGLIVQTAGHIGPGFSGELTLELYNANQVPVSIRYKQAICQVEFFRLETASTKPYKGDYQNKKNQKGNRI
jgi:dCTP deaminase